MNREPKDLVGKPVVSITAGQEIGSVDHLLFQPGEQLLYGFVVKGREKGSPSLLLCLEDVKAMGDAAITVEREDLVRVFDADSQAREYMTLGIQGLRILTEGGQEIGKVDSLSLDDETGAIQSYHTSTGLLGLGSGRDISTTEVISVGRDAIVVSTAAAEKIGG